MDHNTFISTLAKRIGQSSDETAALVNALADNIKNAASELNAVAIPGFGRFEAIKKEEYVAVDRTDGQTKLFPPEITITFTPGSMLKKRLIHE